MARRILIIDGHPDASSERYVHALSAAYRDGARAAGHEVRGIVVSELEFSLLRTGEEFRTGPPSDVIRACQQDLVWAEHLAILFPLWLGSMPALLKGFFEQVLRPGFAFAAAERAAFQRKLLHGRSARIIVTMGMPALFYRWYLRAHSLKSVERNILRFCGLRPIRACVVGPVESMGPAGRGNWLARVHALGKQAS
jgi:putative NADPH-quinone reductase